MNLTSSTWFPTPSALSLHLQVFEEVVTRMMAEGHTVDVIYLDCRMGPTDLTNLMQPSHKWSNNAPEIFFFLDGCGAAIPVSKLVKYLEFRQIICSLPLLSVLEPQTRQTD